MNINRDYLIINDVKKSNVKLDNGSILFYITDKNTQNIFVNLVINVSNNDLIQKYANIENAEDYTLTMNIVKPSNAYKVIEGKLHDKGKAIFEFDLNEDCCDEVGTYKCELLTKCDINGHEEITTSNKLTYKVKSSILNDLDDIVEAPEYPLVIQLFEKLSDINQYEEDRRANELARQLAEQQRQTRFDVLDADMVDRVTTMDDKMVDVENRVSAKEQAVDKLILDTKADIDDYKVAKDQEIDEYKVAKDAEIDEYKTTKDTEINNAITTQDNKIDTAINAQNDRIVVVENNVVAQNSKLDTLQNKATIHEERITATEVKNTEQDNRLDIIENTNTQQNSRLTTIEAKNVEQDNRLNDIEAIDVSQNNRLNAIEAKNQQQDDRLQDIEKVNNRQDIDIKCLYGASQTIDVTKEGNSIYLQNSNNGFTIVDEIKGNTLVNCNKEPDKELILNGNINTSGDNTVTITEGVDGGLVDVALEGNTLVNVSKTKDITALPLEEDLTYLYANTQYTLQFVSDKAITADITLGGTQLLSQSIVAGLNRISITTPATLTDNKLIINGNDTGANIMEVIVTDIDRELEYFEGMKSVGEGKELQVISINSERRLVSTQRLTHEPLRGVGDVKDRYVMIDGKWYIERKCGYRNNYSICDAWSNENLTNRRLKLFKLDNSIEEFNDINILRKVKSNKFKCVQYGYTDGRFNVPFLAYITENGNLWVSADINYTQQDMLNYINDCQFVYELQTPTYEPINYNPLEVYSGTTHISTNSAVPCNIIIKNTGFNCLLKPSTTYTISSNLGLNTVTTPSTLTEDCLRFMDTDTSDITTMRDVLVLEGDWTTKADLIPANFSGIESAFEQEYDAEKGKYKVNIKVANEDKTEENNIEFYINEPLRGVGTAKDRVYIKDDKVVVQRNCGSATFDGSDDEGWAFRSNSDGYSRFYRGDNTLALNPKILCDTLNSYPSLSIAWVGEGTSGHSNSHEFRLYLKEHRLTTQDVAGLKQWLQQNPVTVVYQLAEPIYEEVEYNDVKLFIESFKNSTLSYNSNVPVQSKLYYSYSVPIVDTVAQTADISDQQDSMIIDLATQVAVMEMMLM